MTRGQLMVSNLTLSEPRLFPASHWLKKKFKGEKE